MKQSSIMILAIAIALHKNFMIYVKRYFQQLWLMSDYFKTHDVNVNECVTYDEYSNCYYPDTYEIESFYYSADSQCYDYGHNDTNFVYEQQTYPELSYEPQEEQQQPVLY